MELINTITLLLSQVIIVLSIWTLCGGVLYNWFGWFKWFFHDILKWHKPDNSPKWSDGCSTHSVCKYCGQEIMQDSQGNWF